MLCSHARLLLFLVFISFFQPLILSKREESVEQLQANIRYAKGKVDSAVIEMSFATNHVKSNIRNGKPMDVHELQSRITTVLLFDSGCLNSWS